MSLIHSKSAYSVSEPLGTCCMYVLCIGIFLSVGKQTCIKNPDEHSDKNKKMRRPKSNHPTLLAELYCNYFKHHVSGIFLSLSIFLIHTTSVTSPARSSNIVQNFFFAQHLSKVFVSILTDVSLSLALSETLWKVAAASEVLPGLVLINHSQSVYSPLSPSLSSASLASSLSRLI